VTRRIDASSSAPRARVRRGRRARPPPRKSNCERPPAKVKRMVLGSAGQVSTAMLMLSVLNRLPGKDRMMAKVIEPIHRAANAIELKEY
jgi:hypothetical protein